MAYVGYVHQRGMGSKRRHGSKKRRCDKHQEVKDICRHNRAIAKRSHIKQEFLVSR